MSISINSTRFCEVLTAQTYDCRRAEIAQDVEMSWSRLRCGGWEAAEKRGLDFDIFDTAPRYRLTPSNSAGAFPETMNTSKNDLTLVTIL